MFDLILGLHLLTHHEDPIWKPAITECRRGFEFIPRHCTTQPERRYDGHNPGLYAIDRASGFGGGFYRNSEYRWSLHAEWTYEPVHNVDFALGALPLMDGMAARLSFLPGWRGSAQALHLSLEFKP